LTRSNSTHKKLHVEPPDLRKQFQDIATLIDALLKLDISKPVKRRMLNHAIWEVNQAQGRFSDRYRSSTAISNVGVEIQRDHVFQKKILIDSLLQNTQDVNSVLRKATCCVISREEHTRLTRHRKEMQVDGWLTYIGCGIVVHDMSTGKPLTDDDLAILDATD
jgi:hypothetical protein